MRHRPIAWRALLAAAGMAAALPLVANAQPVIDHVQIAFGGPLPGLEMPRHGLPMPPGQDGGPPGPRMGFPDPHSAGPDSVMPMLPLLGGLDLTEEQRDKVSKGEDGSVGASIAASRIAASYRQSQQQNAHDGYQAHRQRHRRECQAQWQEPALVMQATPSFKPTERPEEQFQRSEGSARVPSAPSRRGPARSRSRGREFPDEQALRPPSSAIVAPANTLMAKDRRTPAAMQDRPAVAVHLWSLRRDRHSRHIRLLLRRARGGCADPAHAATLQNSGPLPLAVRRRTGRRSPRPPRPAPAYALSGHASRALRRRSA